jgi:uncharacterized protein
MTNDLSAEEVRALVKREPHATCGFVRITFISNQRIAPGGLPAPFLDGRPAGSALYFMVTPDAPVRLHHIRNDQLYHRYLGDPIEVLMLNENGTRERGVIGPDLHRTNACSF